MTPRGFTHELDLDDLPPRSARVLATSRGPLAIVRTADDRIYALDDRCPHQGAPLSLGTICDDVVYCALHEAAVHLPTGALREPDVRCPGHAAPARPITVHPVRIVGRRVYVTVVYGDVSTGDGPPC